jgi:MraZ protein
MIFVGTHNHTLDDKGRLVLPARFRGPFADSAYLSPGAGCISLREPEPYEQMLDRLTERVRTGEIEPLTRSLVAHASTIVRPDAQGRIVIPERLRAFASLEHDVVVCGTVDSVEIWDAPAWSVMSADMDRLVSDLFLRGGGI